MPGYVYILTNQRKTTLYIGVTTDLRKRLSEHLTGIYQKSFTNRYNLTQLVYYQTHDNVTTAITEEKRLKAGSRRAKEELINHLNPTWSDLSSDWM